MNLPLPSADASLTRWLLVALATGALVWITFFDSHSLLRRYQWHQEYEELSQENEQLRRDIQRLDTQLDQPLSNDVVERIAREEYGMKRSGEVVYRVEE